MLILLSKTGNSLQRKKDNPFTGLSFLISFFAVFTILIGIVLPVLAIESKILIGVVGPKTGALTQYGNMIQEGVDTAVEHINAQGGIHGQFLKIVTIDDGCDPKQAPYAANRVLNNKINFVIGPVCSGAAISATTIYNSKGIVMVTPSATTPILTDNKNYDFIFRTIGRDDQQGPAAANYITEKIKPKSIAVLHDKQSYGQGIANSVKNNLIKNGLDVTIFEGINAGDSDYSSIITKLKSLGIDFIYFGGYHPEMGLLLRQAAEQGLKSRFMGPEGVGNHDINIIAGSYTEGMLLTLPTDFTKNFENKNLVKEFNDKKRNVHGVFQLTAYSALKVIADSIEQTKSTNPMIIAKHMHAHTFDTPIGKISWNSQGDLDRFKFDVYSWHQDGSKSLCSN